MTGSGQRMYEFNVIKVVFQWGKRRIYFYAAKKYKREKNIDPNSHSSEAITINILTHVFAFTLFSVLTSFNESHT